MLLTEDPRSQPASLYTQALNEVFDIREKRRFALNDRVPAAVTCHVVRGLDALAMGTRRPIAAD